MNCFKVFVVIVANFDVSIFIITIILLHYNSFGRYQFLMDLKLYSTATYVP